MNGFDILLWLLSIGTFIGGYYVGSRQNPADEIKEARAKLERSIRKRTGTVGPVTRPSASKVNLWSKPKEVEEQEEFKRSFQEQTGREHP